MSHLKETDYVKKLQRKATVCNKDNKISLLKRIYMYLKNAGDPKVIENWNKYMC